MFVSRKDSGVHKGMQVERSHGMFIPFVDDLHPLLLDSALLKELDGLDSMNHGYDDV